MKSLLFRVARSMTMADDLNLPAGWEWVEDIVNAINTLLWPLLIIVGAAGSIYAIIIGVNMARADSAEKREEAKKKLINVIVGLAVTIALILFFKLFISTILPAFFKDGNVGVGDSDDAATQTMIKF